MAVSHRTIRSTLGLGALALCWPLSGCGDFTADPLPSSGGSGGTASTAGSPSTSGSPASGGGGAGSGGSASGGGGAASSAGSGSGGRPVAPEPSCTDVVACGGEVAGTWFATGSCLPISGMADLTSYGIGCLMAPVTGKVEVAGNWTFADGKLNDATTTKGEVTMEMDKQCLNISGTVSTCQKLALPLSSIGAEMTCVDSTMTAGGCTCTGKIDQMGSAARISLNAAKTGKFMAASNKLSISGDTREYDYCVSGEFMTVTMKTKNDIGQVNGTVVFQKQP